METKKPVKGFLDFDRLFKYLSKEERAKRAEAWALSRKEGGERKGKVIGENNASPTKGV